VLTPQRSPIFPDVPTIAESGFKGFEASVWYALMAPAKTPMPSSSACMPRCRRRWLRPKCASA
jgi:tripartite-type tricarboxylate transporter receptor subunit TctC